MSLPMSATLRWRGARCSKLALARRTSAGQVMLITVLILGSAILGATVIAGTLTTQRIRQSISVTESAKAIFAADAGLEDALYRCIKNDPPVCSDFESSNEEDPSLTNGTSYKVTCKKDSEGNLQEIRSVGTSRDSIRALRIVF